jgi:excisionase family DNA binding protein
MRTTRRMREPLIDIDEVADRLGVSTRYVRRLVAERRIAYLKIGRLLRFDVDVVDAWLEACAVNAYEGSAQSPIAQPTKPAVQRSMDSSSTQRR